VPTTTPPTTTPQATLPAADVVERSVPVVVPTTTTTTAPPATTTVPPPLSTESVHYGQVTYYAHPAGTCASPFLPFGTVVRVTNPANGASVSCLVNDREADTARSIDLATATFAELAPLSQGVIDAELSW
jgi:rare lipoprotein A